VQVLYVTLSYQFTSGIYPGYPTDPQFNVNGQLFYLSDDAYQPAVLSDPIADYTNYPADWQQGIYLENGPGSIDQSSPLAGYWTLMITGMSFTKPSDFDSQPQVSDGNGGTGNKYDVAVVPDNFQINNGALPNLAAYINSVSTNSAAAGGQLTVNTSIGNGGAGAAGPEHVGYYIASDANFTTNVQFIEAISIGSIAANTLQPFPNVAVSIPSTVTPGTYYLRAVANYDDQVAETNYNDNASNAVQITVTAPTATLFTSGADTVDFAGTSASQGLTASQVAAINAGADLYDALGGNDAVTLPNLIGGQLVAGSLVGGQYVLKPAPGAPAINANITWDPTHTFTIGSANDTASNNDTVTGGAGNYRIQINGPATVNIAITGDGGNTITDGSGADTVAITGNGNNTIYGGTGADTLNLSGSGQNTFTFAPGAPPTLSGNIINNGSLTFTANGTGTFGANATLSGTGNLFTQGGTVVLADAGGGFHGDTTIRSGTLELANSTAAGSQGSIIFTGTGQTLQIDGTVMPNAVIRGFEQGDEIDLTIPTGLRRECWLELAA
jgi:CARDB